MHYHSNHCWCSESNWDNKTFDVTHMVDIKKYPKYDVNIAHSDQVIADDWFNNINEVPTLSLKEYEHNKCVYAKLEEKHGTLATDEQLRGFSMKKCPTPDNAVMQWLNDNVKPSTDKRRKDRPEAWCIGNADYRMDGETGAFTFWFLRRRDAMKFIKEFSIYKKPTSYLNYFTDDRRELIDGKLVKVEG
jgi:hypothetical protein